MINNNIRLAQSNAVDARQAVYEFHSGVTQPNLALVIFFCSSNYDLDALATEMRNLFSGIQVIGCTSAGEIGPNGYSQSSLSGASFSKKNCAAVHGIINNLQHFERQQGHSFSQNLLQQFENQKSNITRKNSFALMLIDGMSIREEPVAHALQYALGDIVLFGGSAGDDQKFNKTYIYSDGKFHQDSALLLLVSITFPFKIFETQHFKTTEERLVVTKTAPLERKVLEINGLPAAAEYARLLGVNLHELNSICFADSPIVIMINGNDYVRSIQKANPDGSLTFFCAIEEGLVLRVAHGVDLLKNLQLTFDEIRSEIGPPQLIIACDCILRKMEVCKNGLQDSVAQIFHTNNTVGFNSYGEQFHGIHVNQTLTGIAIGYGEPENG